MSKQQQATSGFTIIEVLIVLAIAGLILLIIFEAIPALARSGRNNQRRQDVSAILESVSHWELENSGGFPAPCGASGDPSGLCNLPPSLPDLPNGNPLYHAKLTYYDDNVAGNVIIAAGDPAVINLPAEANTAIVDVYNFYKCDPGNQGAAISTGAGYNDVVALYALETGGKATSECQQL